MQWAVIAERAGVTPSDLDDLLRGIAYASVQERLGVPMGYIDSYISNNSASAELANRLGFHIAAAEALGVKLCREGRIGLILGLLVGS